MTRFVCLFAVLLAVGIAAIAPPSVTFTEIGARAGIHFRYHNGATGKRYLPETMGAGCAFIDLDGDGWPDILLINGKDFAPRGQKSLPAGPLSQQPRRHLYRHHQGQRSRRRNLRHGRRCRRLR